VRPAFLAATTVAGRARTIAMAGTRAAAARATSACRAGASTLVASTTVSRRAPSRFSSSRWRIENARPVARWSAASPETASR
jgi:hypothetical protein